MHYSDMHVLCYGTAYTYVLFYLKVKFFSVWEVISVELLLNVEFIM